MDEEKVRENKLANSFVNSLSKSRPEPVTVPPETYPASYQSSPGGEDTFLSPEAFSGHQKVENTINNLPNADKNGSDKQPDKNEQQVAHIDTAAPFESVKEAVSKFGAIVDWKAHRVQTNERRKYIEEELEKAQEDIPVFKKKAEAAEEAKEQALRDLNSTKRLIEELKLNLERALTEEHQALQDSELAQLRVSEMEQGINDESSVAAKTQLELAKARHQAAASELVTAKNDLEETRKDYQILISERDSAVQKAQEAVSAAKEVEREVESLTIQLVTTKESIEETHASHLESEEHRVQEVNERDQEALNWEQEIKQTEEELEKVKEQIPIAKDVKSKLETASGVLQKLKDELAIYMQGKMPEEDEADKFTRKDISSGVAIAKKNLDEIKHSIEIANEQIMCLKTTQTSLTAKLESEKKVLTSIRKQKGLGAGAVVNLESELKRTKLELDSIRKKDKEAREKLVELPKQLQKVTEDTKKAKSLVEEARSVFNKAKEAAEQAKSGVNSIEDQLASTQKEIEAARAKEKLAIGAINALHETESGRGPKNDEVTISLEEYYELSKRGYEAEQAASKRVSDAILKIDEAKDSEMQCLNKLTLLNSELAAQKEALNAALQKAEMAKETKMNIEEELRKEKGESDPKRKEEGRGGLFRGFSKKGNQDTPSHNPSSGNAKSNTKGGSPESNSNADDDTSPDIKGLLKKKKRTFMPKFSLMLTGKKKPFFHKN
ncbi:WEB family, Prefoldin [Artemisia annua]|uniref:WEB family, Prefoldin n=1 Tax=Artemisia annua TaxID=35608 RepID=A0A2U1NZ00_ARTAN|nr:WEB family, Prefoldin [Artemisia annua]